METSQSSPRSSKRACCFASSSSLRNKATRSFASLLALLKVETLIEVLPAFYRRFPARGLPLYFIRNGRRDSFGYLFQFACFVVNRRTMRVGDQIPEEDLLEIKFRLYDGSDIGPFRFAAASTVGAVKSRIIADWPKDKKLIPKTASDLKLISAGKILENQKTIAQSRPSFGELPGGVITMHVVVQPSLTKSKTEKKVDDMPKKSNCTCSIL